MAKMNIGKRILAAVLSLVLVLNLSGIVSVFAAQTDIPDLVENFQDTYYKQDGTAGTADDWEIHLSKTAAPAAQENVYDITLTVETKDISTQLAGAAHGAVALVLDVSSSMAKDAGVCVNCGKAEDHNDHKGRQKVCTYKGTTHLALLKNAVNSFLDSYAATAEQGDMRLVAVVKFATNADTVLSWIDVSNADNLAAVKAAVNAMSSTSGTNIEAGLALGRNLLNMSELNNIPLENQSLILFSDGSPTVAVGNANDTSTTHVSSGGNGIGYGGGSSSSDDLAGILAAVSAKKKAVAYNTDADLLNSVFGAANVITSNVDSLVPDLTAEAGKIVTSKTSASTVTDPMAAGISMVSVHAGYDAAAEKWDLSQYTPTVADGITTYTITYQVQIDPVAVAADPNYPGYTVLTPANGATTLNYTYGEENTSVCADFNEPNVRGIRSFTVRYEYVGTVPEGAAAVPAEQTYKAGQSVQVADAPTLENYTFSGWSKTDFTMPAEDVVITGSWSENAKYSYSLTYNANFGANEMIGDAENVASIYAASHSIEVDENMFSRDNYTFIGWNTEADGSGVAYAAGDVVTLTAQNNEEVLYAQWQEHPKYDYAVTYNANFGQTPATADDEQNVSGTYAAAYSIDVNENMFSRENHTFIGWAEEPQGEVVYAAGDQITFTQGGQKTLYAKWIEHDKYAYTVIYNGNGGALAQGELSYGDSENVESTYATSHNVSVDANTFIREHYDFIGWNTETDGSGVAYSAEDVIALTAQDNTRTLYAQWQEHPKYDYAVSYNANFGETPEVKEDAQNVTGIYETEYRIEVDENTFAREGYTFVGWNTEADGSGVAYSAEDVIALTAQDNIRTLYAQWQIKEYEYTVRYMVRVDNGAYAAFAGQLPENAPVGGKAVYGQTLNADTLEGVPAAISDSTYTYAYTALEGIQIPAEPNVVTVYYTYVTPEKPVDPPVDPVDPVDPPVDPVNPVDPVDPPVVPVTPPVVDIPDEPVPLAPADPAPAAPAQSSGLVDIPDDQVPLASVPKTGDPIFLYAGMSLLSGLGLLGLNIKKKEDQEA